MLNEIGNLLKQNYRLYSRDLISILEEQGYSDIRPSFLEILIHLLSNEGDRIKNIGDACGLKKQTMTTHLNALEKRGYISRVENTQDKRQQGIIFTDDGMKLKFALVDSINMLEKKYISILTKLELERIKVALQNMNVKLKDRDQLSLPF